MDTRIQMVEKILRQAGSLFFDEKLYKATTGKGGEANYATEVDYRVQELLVDQLKRLLPESNIITEESDQNRFVFDKPTWILDPVDGTTNLMHQYGYSAISLALYVDGQPSLGFVYNPYTREMFTAQKGQGAFLNNEKITVSSHESMNKGLIAFGTNPYDRKEAESTFKIVYEVFMQSQEIRRSGSAALDIVYVACGRLEGFFEMRLQPWDYAAGALILTEAGGLLTNWMGASVNILAPDSVLATNRSLHPSLMQIINSIKIT